MDTWRLRYGRVVALYKLPTVLIDSVRSSHVPFSILHPRKLSMVPLTFFKLSLSHFSTHDLLTSMICALPLSLRPASHSFQTTLRKQPLKHLPRATSIYIQNHNSLLTCPQPPILTTLTIVMGINSHTLPECRKIPALNPFSAAKRFVSSLDATLITFHYFACSSATSSIKEISTTHLRRVPW